MARTRPALQAAINQILECRGQNGKRMSYRQAERLTGLSPATIGELAKGNARTPETVRRFAQGMGEEMNRLLLLAGFVPEAGECENETPPFYAAAIETPSRFNQANLNRGDFDRPDFDGMDGDEREWLGRLGRALAKMPPGRERDLWKDSLRRNAELVESFLERLAQTEASEHARAERDKASGQENARRGSQDGPDAS